MCGNMFASTASEVEPVFRRWGLIQRSVGFLPYSLNRLTLNV